MDKAGEATGLAFLFWIESAAALLWCASIAAALADRRITRKLVPECAGFSTADAIAADAVTIVLPARNEAENILAWMADVKAQSPSVARVIIADDSSEDETANIAEQRAHYDARIEVLRCNPPPPGWIGKPWAAHNAALRADTDWLLFTDADMRMQAGTVAAALRAARRLQADALSLTAELECKTVAEKIVMPVVAALIFGAHPISLIQDERSSIALMWGGFMLVRRAAYARVGGHAGVRAQIAEDRALAQRLKAFGYSIRLLNGSAMVRVRMYQGLDAMWQGWRKNFYEGVQRRPLGAIFFIAAIVATLVIPAPLFAKLALTALRRRLWPRERKLMALAAAGCIGAVAVRGLRDPLIGADARSIVATPLAGVFVAAVMAASMWRMITGSGQTWKGRTIH